MCHDKPVIFRPYRGPRVLGRVVIAPLMGSKVNLPEVRLDLKVQLSQNPL